jgi:hypothetical protein
MHQIFVKITKKLDSVDGGITVSFYMIEEIISQAGN